MIGLLTIVEASYVCLYHIDLIISITIAQSSNHLSLYTLIFFFFQAEDGIRDVAVTGVQTCALPIFRFHHQLTKIHPFANGNGRHARMIADVVAVKYGQAEFTWGAGKDLVAEGDVRTRYLAALRALDADENDVNLLLDFARS